MRNKDLTREQLIGKHGRLRQELAGVYADAQWPSRHSGRVERLLAELHDVQAHLERLDPSLAQPLGQADDMPRAA